MVPSWSMRHSSVSIIEDSSTKMILRWWIFHCLPLGELSAAVSEVVLDLEVEERMDGRGRTLDALPENICSLVRCRRHDDIVIFGLHAHQLAHIEIAWQCLVDDIVHQIGLADTGSARDDEFLVRTEQKVHERIGCVLLAPGSDYICLSWEPFR